MGQHLCSPIKQEQPSRRTCLVGNLTSSEGREGFKSDVNRPYHLHSIASTIWTSESISHITMKPVRSLQSTNPTKIPLFLAPAFAELNILPHSATRSFSSTTTTSAPRKGKKDLNRRRGESVIRSTGPRHELRVQTKFKELPKPRAEEDRPLEEFPTNPNHGLYGFFNKDKETVIPSEREEQHGRAWQYEELVFKNFSDLHTIYWQGLLEINRIRTRSIEHKRLKLGFGALELQERLATVSTSPFTFLHGRHLP